MALDDPPAVQHICSNWRDPAILEVLSTGIAYAVAGVTSDMVNITDVECNLTRRLSETSRLSQARRRLTLTDYLRIFFDISMPSKSVLGQSVQNNPDILTNPLTQNNFLSSINAACVQASLIAPSNTFYQIAVDSPNLRLVTNNGVPITTSSPIVSVPETAASSSPVVAAVLGSLACLLVLSCGGCFIWQKCSKKEEDPNVVLADQVAIHITDDILQASPMSLTSPLSPTLRLPPPSPLQAAHVPWAPPVEELVQNGADVIIVTKDEKAEHITV